MHESVLKQYEKMIETSLNVECGLADLSTLDLFNFAQPMIRTGALQDKDLLFVNLNRDYISLAISQKNKLMFYRTRSLERNNGIVQKRCRNPSHSDVLP